MNFRQARFPSQCGVILFSKILSKPLFYRSAALCDTMYQHCKYIDWKNKTFHVVMIFPAHICSEVHINLVPKRHRITLENKIL